MEIEAVRDAGLSSCCPSVLFEEHGWDEDSWLGTWFSGRAGLTHTGVQPQQHTHEPMHTRTHVHTHKPVPALAGGGCGGKRSSELAGTGVMMGAAYVPRDRQTCVPSWGH